MADYVFRGTFEQCLERLRRGPLEGVEELTNFVQAHPDTVSGWLFRYAKLPTGEALVRSVVFFELIGWKVVEFERIDPLAMELAKLWAFNLMSGPKIREELGYRTENTALLEFIYGRRQPAKKNREKAERLIRQCARIIRQREAAFRRMYQVAGINDRPAISGNPEVNGDVVERLATHLSMVMPLAERVASDACTDEDRERLRQLVGPEEYVTLAVTLNALKSYRTRDEAKKAGMLK